MQKPITFVVIVTSQTFQFSQGFLQVPSSSGSLLKRVRAAAKHQLGVWVAPTTNWVSYPTSSTNYGSEDI